MKVYAYPADTFGCGHYRLIWPAEALRQNHGVDVQLVWPGEYTGIGIRRSITGQYLDPIYPEDADVIVLQRPSHPQLVDAITLLRGCGVAVVVDVDDDLRHIHPSNPAWAHLHPKSLTDHSWSEVSRACRDATLVTVSTPQLEKVYGAHGRAATLFNYVPWEYTQVEHNDAAWVGWAGSTHSHPDDLRAMGSSIADTIADGVPFRIVGTAAGASRQLGLAVDPNETGNVEFYDWPEAVTKIGVGVAPLADTVFNASKSWLKPLEYSAFGVPWVASPRIEYERLHNLGVGQLAETASEWRAALKRLVGDEVLRGEESERCREVASTLTIEEHAWRWAEVWERAVELQKKAPLPPIRKWGPARSGRPPKLRR